MATTTTYYLHTTTHTFPFFFFVFLFSLASVLFFSKAFLSSPSHWTSFGSIASPIRVIPCVLLSLLPRHHALLPHPVLTPAHSAPVGSFAFLQARLTNPSPSICDRIRVYILLRAPVSARFDSQRSRFGIGWSFLEGLRDVRSSSCFSSRIMEWMIEACFAWLYAVPLPESSLCDGAFVLARARFEAQGTVRTRSAVYSVLSNCGSSFTSSWIASLTNAHWSYFTFLRVASLWCRALLEGLELKSRSAGFRTCQSHLETSSWCSLVSQVSSVQ